MTEQFYRTAIAGLTSYLGSAPNDTLYGCIWAEFKHRREDVFGEIVREIMRTFRPTATIPFPLIVHFRDAEENIIPKNTTQEYYRQWKSPQIEDKDCGPMTDEEIEVFHRSLPWNKTKQEEPSLSETEDKKPAQGGKNEAVEAAERHSDAPSDEW